MPTHVLIVDDDPDIRGALRMILEEEGYRVQEARDGLIALDIMRESSHPLVVLTNHHMPVLDGPGLLSFVAQDPRLARRDAFIYMTAGNRIISPDVAQTLDELHVPVLRKPFDIQHLADLVAQAAGRLHLHHDADSHSNGEASHP